MANLRAVIGKLNPTTRNALEGAAGLCLARTHYNVEIEHFLMKLLDSSGSDFALHRRASSAWTSPVCRANSAAAWTS